MRATVEDGVAGSDEVAGEAVYEELRRAVAEFLAVEKIESRRELEQQRVRSYWQVGRLLHDAMPRSRSGRRAAYGNKIVPRLAEDVDVRERLLYEMLHFRQRYSKLPTSAVLGWSHYRCLLRVDSKKARTYYAHLADQQAWSVRQLDLHVQEGLFERSQEGASDEEFPELALGRLFTYRVLASERGPRLDLGFGIQSRDHLVSLEGVEPGDIVESQRAQGGGVAAYGVRRLDTGEDTLYTYRAEVERVIDGDTLKVMVDLGLGMMVEQTIRLRGIDAPEMSREEGLMARDFVVEALGASPDVVVSTRWKDKYGRYLADLMYHPRWRDAKRIRRGGHLLNRELVAAGMAARYRR